MELIHSGGITGAGVLTSVARIMGWNMTRSQRGARRPNTCLNLSVIRQKSGRTLHQIAETTKISFRFLEAIEKEDFKKLPGGIFDRSYIRQYAAEIGIEPEEILAAYESRTAPTSQHDEVRGRAAEYFRRLGFLNPF